MNTIRYWLTLAVLLTIGAAGKARNFVPISFDSYIETVAHHNLDYIVEQYNTKIVFAGAQAQSVFEDPELAFEAMHQNLLVELRYTLSMGKRKARIDLARIQAETESLSLEWFFHQLRAEAAEIFVETLAHAEVLKARTEIYSHVRTLAKTDSTRRAAGEISDGEMTLTRLAEAAARDQMLYQQGEYMASLVEMNLYMGNTTDKLHTPHGTLDHPAAMRSLQQYIALAEENRKDVEAAAKGNQTAIANVRNTKVERRPDIGLMAGYERNWHGMLPKHHNMLKTGIYIPLKFSNANDALVRQANYEACRASAERESTQARARAETVQAYYRCNSFEEMAAGYRSGTMHEALNTARANLFALSEGSEELSEICETYIQASDRHIDALREYGLAVIRLNRCAGIWEVSF